MTYKIVDAVQTVAPVVEPVTVAEAKSHLRVDGSDSDTYIGTLIIAARQMVENWMQRSLVQRTYRADVSGFAYGFDLPYKPLASLSSVKYYNTDSPQVLTTLDSSYYRADLLRGEIYLDVGAIIPSVSTQHDAVQITYVAGYEPSADSPQDHAGNVPNAIKAAILLVVGHLFENREATSQLRIQELPTVEMLLSGYRYY